MGHELDTSLCVRLDSRQLTKKEYQMHEENCELSASASAKGMGSPPEVKDERSESFPGGARDSTRNLGKAPNKN